MVVLENSHQIDVHEIACITWPKKSLEEHNIANTCYNVN